MALRKLIYHPSGRAGEYADKGYATTCACGCGGILEKNKKGYFAKFKRGHHTRGIPKSQEHKRKLSESHKGVSGPWAGKQIPEWVRKRMSDGRKGMILSPKHRENIKSSLIKFWNEADDDARIKQASWTGKRHSIKTRKKMSESQRGELGSNWKGGISPENLIARASMEFKEWRIAVFTRDNFTCQDCGESISGKLHAHHIKLFSTHPGLRFDVNNGLTLCGKCHGKRHNRRFI